MSSPIAPHPDPLPASAGGGSRLKALIKVGYGCNENCTFCHTLEHRHLHGATEEVHRKIDRAHQLGHSMVVLSGGEPTLRPELLDWASHVARLGLDLGLVTNGLLFAYPERLERLLAQRLKYVYMSLHGGSAKVHNRVVRADTFGAAMKAVKNLSGRGLDLTLNAVLVKQNVDHLEELVDAVLPFPDVVLKFSMIQPKGGGDAHFDALAPTVTVTGARVLAAIRYGQARAGPSGPRFAHDGLPFCHLPGAEGLYDDLRTHRFATMVEADEPDFFPVDEVARVQPAPCLRCALRGACPGLYRGYHHAFGAGELEPVEGGPRSNSYTFTLETVVPTPAEGCLLLEDGVTPWDRARTLFVQHQGKLARYRTTTRDFADVELEDVKHRAGQLYYDASRKDAPTDFARDLVQLRRSARCLGCPQRERCTGLFEPALEDVFTRDDARVRALLSELTGEVLDVGCGEGPYDDLLAPRARAGAIRYVGVEPDPALLEGLQRRRPWGRHLTGTAETLEALALGAFDHLLVLRSWNHLARPEAAVRQLVSHLRPGGTLLIVDNEAFGLARTAAHTRRAERSSARFEHYRNDRAADAHALLRGLELLERRDVAPDTSNQWLLRYRRAGP